MLPFEKSSRYRSYTPNQSGLCPRCKKNLNEKIPDLSFVKSQMQKPRSNSIKISKEVRLKENLVNLIASPDTNFKKYRESLKRKIKTDSNVSEKEFGDNQEKDIWDTNDHSLQEKANKDVSKLLNIKTNQENVDKEDKSLSNKNKASIKSQKSRKIRENGDKNIGEYSNRNKVKDSHKNKSKGSSTNYKLRIRPPSRENSDLNISEINSNESTLKKKDFLNRRLASREIVVKDWAKTNLYKNYLINGITEFNHESYEILFTEDENLNLYDLIKQRYESSESCKGILANFFSKALNTFKELMISMGFNVQFSAIKNKYSKTSVEDTLKLLLRNRMLLNSRKQLLKIFDSIIRFKILKVEFKEDCQWFSQNK